MLIFMIVVDHWELCQVCHTLGSSAFILHRCVLSRFICLIVASLFTLSAWILNMWLLLDNIWYITILFICLTKHLYKNTFLIFILDTNTQKKGKDLNTGYSACYMSNSCTAALCFTISEVAASVQIWFLTSSSSSIIVRINTWCVSSM